MNRALPIVAAVIAALTFVGVAVGSAATGRVIAIVGLSLTGACLWAWVTIRRTKGL